ncbi:MG2 domain-containing protein [Glaciimonas sp. Cout2]|uniref:alpha-2-macroglobulin family protein n=2 Tax=unclassified Glaciimonas TaxID=2644401 RepID=UPI002B233BA6|nr:MG2 domain-containing protein [Glaciimonas sp. Cout2]MEB0010147.1 MG2 domain-containing protein [Glaciimonas sp. Cout2]
MLLFFVFRFLGVAFSSPVAMVITTTLRQTLSILRTTPLPILIAVSLIFAQTVQAAPRPKIDSFSPEGEITHVRQVRVKFSEAAVKFGDPKAPMPFDIQCKEAGSGRWADDKNWIYDFERDVPPGTRCSFALKSDFTLLSGAVITGKKIFQFNTGGPAVINVMPRGDSIDEEQVFILVQNGVATSDSLLKHVYCEAEGVHERIPVKLITGASRKVLLDQFAEKINPEVVSTVQCQQRLPNDSAVRLTWDKGVVTPSGIATTQPQVFKFKVRPSFTASVSCERENANAACAPILPLRILFTSPVTRALAEAVTLNGSNGKLKPFFEKNNTDDTVWQLTFKPPFAERSELTIVLPSGFHDESGRPLTNANSFPMKVRMADYPPLAKFPSAPFGIIELNADATLPVTLRSVETNMLARSADGKVNPGNVSNLKVTDDQSVIAWLTKLNRYHETTITIGKKSVETRSIGLLANQAGAKTLSLPHSPDAKNGVRPFEVIGIPLKDPGFYVIELESQKLGAALLGKAVPMYVRTSALVTNLSVHVKIGRQNGAVWVTTLDNAKPVENADVRIADCRGTELWRGKTNKLGIAMVPEFPEDGCRSGRQSAPGQIDGLFVSARKIDEKGRADMTFALTSWNNGIESWRFNLPMDNDKSATVRAHTVFDRTLFRAGETASMKHVIRTETMQGFGLLPKDQLPTRVRIIHQGSGQEFQFPLIWRGQKNAETVFAIPKEAKLGRYDVTLDSGTVKSDTNDTNDTNARGQRSYSTGSFRVEEFRLPLLQGRITPPKTLIAPTDVPLGVQLNYLNGGGASGQAVHITSLLRTKAISFSAYDGYSFSTLSSESNDGSSDNANGDDQKIVADKLPVTLDKNGAGKAVIKDLPAIIAPKELLTEMTFADPNGEIQTVSSVAPVWPSAIVVGLKAGEWISVKKKLTLTAVALNPAGQPQVGIPIEISGRSKQTNSHRKRMVGGFYAYENTNTSTDLGALCSGKTDARGVMMCSIELSEAGNVELTAEGKDGSGKASLATSSVWVTKQGELWFDGENQDRIDILPEKKHYQPGETAKFQVRMPFRYATALIAIEREGVIDTQVMQLNGQDPTFSLPVKASYGPNVFVSVLAVRGRMRDVPWYSFFTWGWKEPLNWWSEFKEYQAPGATVDLAKPAYKFGIAEIMVGTAANQLAVTVKADQPSYAIRTVAKVTIQANLPNGKPAARAEIAVAAVDEALLELEPNRSWDLLQAMLQRRSYGVETSTAQMQVVGKRHYGRKAIPAGGGGGKSPTRELFDTLLLWKPVILLDANGRAQIDVPLNDALSSFKIVAVAQSGDSLFGTGSVSIRSTQDLQLISGLPPLVREGDNFSAMVTVRNTTTHAMQVNATAQASGAAVLLPTSANALTAPTRSAQAVLPIMPTLQWKELSIPPGESRELVWQVTVPSGVKQLTWEINAQEQGGAKVKDSIKFTQRVVPAVPVTVQQATFFQLDKAFSLQVSQPADALPGRGGVAVVLSPSLAGNNEGLRRYFTEYPFSCLEQQASRAIGLQDNALWQKVLNGLPTYLDSDGLAYYYPPTESNARRGSDTLTAYLLAITQESGFAISQPSRDKMLDGLTAFVEGKITRDFWSPQKDLDVRKLAALEALSRYDRARPSMLGAIQLSPNRWPTSAVLDWINILQRVTSIPERAKRLAEADQILRSRLNYQGTRMGFSTESSDYWWWLMTGGDVNANRLVLTVLNDPAWKDGMSKLINGAIQRQSRGHWSTTTANSWGSLALQKFSQKFESEKVSGITKVALEPGIVSANPNPPNGQNFSWLATGGGKLQIPWASSATPATLKLTHIGGGAPWINVQSLAAVVLKKPFSSGYRINKNIVPIEQKEKGKYTRGDIYKINLEVDAQTDMTWVVVTDPIPAGGTLLGSGLGRDSAISTLSERPSGSAWLAYEERSFEAFRSYYEYVPKGKFIMTYTFRINNPGEFNLPPTRVEAMYAPEMFGESPNPKWTVK